MITTLLFDFNNVLLFQSKATIEALSNQVSELEIPGAYSPFFYINQELLKYIQEKKKTYQTVILSASEFTLDQPVVKNAVADAFDQIIMAKEYGWAKDLPATYMATAEKLKTNPNQIIFTDDKIANVEAAAAAGLSSIHFENNTQFIAQLEKQLAAQA